MTTSKLHGQISFEVDPKTGERHKIDNAKLTGIQYLESGSFYNYISQVKQDLHDGTIVADGLESGGSFLPAQFFSVVSKDMITPMIASGFTINNALVQQVGSFKDDTVAVPVENIRGAISLYNDRDVSKATTPKVNFRTQKFTYISSHISIGMRESQKYDSIGISALQMMISNTIQMMSLYREFIFIFGSEFMQDVPPVSGLLQQQGTMEAIGELKTTLDIAKKVFDALSTIVTKTGGLFSPDIGKVVVTFPTSYSNTLEQPLYAYQNRSIREYLEARANISIQFNPILDVATNKTSNYLTICANTKNAIVNNINYYTVMLDSFAPYNQYGKVHNQEYITSTGGCFARYPELNFTYFGLPAGNTIPFPTGNI